MLAYFLESLPALGLNLDLALAACPSPNLSRLLPPHTPTFPLPENQRFSLLGAWRQSLALLRLRKTFPCDLLHGWTARDWELTSLAARFSRRPAIGLLHDHPRAAHHSPTRQRLMLNCARFGLHRVLCVSQAVALACRSAGYPADRLRTIPNGIPLGPSTTTPSPGPSLHLGFLGVYSTRKGLHHLFQILDLASRQSLPDWHLSLAGAAQEPDGEALVAEIHQSYSSRPWWPRVHWKGWTRDTASFLASLDLLILPSSDFDPFPTVLLEAGAAARPAFAARVGGVPEIIIPNQTGWLYNPSDIPAAADQLASILRQPHALSTVGAAHAHRVREHFSVQKMTRNYLSLYQECLGIDAPPPAETSNAS